MCCQGRYSDQHFHLNFLAVALSFRDIEEKLLLLLSSVTYFCGGFQSERGLVPVERRTALLDEVRVIRNKTQVDRMKFKGDY